MTIFHVLKYPLGDGFIPMGGIPGVLEVKKAFPELYEKWLETSWQKLPRPPDRPGFENRDVSGSIKDLRRMLLEYEDPDDDI